jgi:amino acid adenylation domain-containing protein
MSTLSEIIFEAAHSFKSFTAIKAGSREISYDELNSKALAVASILTVSGAKSETIGLVGQRKASSYIGILGILYAGCHYTPINPKYSAARLQAIIQDAGIRFLVGDVDDLLKLGSVLPEEVFPPVVIVPEETVPAGKKWISISDTSSLLKPVKSGMEEMAYLLYTSGSTGAPKGVKVSHNNITTFLKSMSALYILEPGFRASQTFDFSFDPSVSDMFFTWSQGGQLCVLPEEEMMLPSEYIRREKINYWNSVPSLAAFMSKMGQLSKNCFPDLQYSMFCGEQFPKHIADLWKQAAPNSTVENLYGPTEATIYISRYEYKKEDEEKIFRNSIIPIGHPFPQHEVAIVDDEGKKVVDGDTGEICFKGKQVTEGYLHDEVKTNAVFVNFDWDSKESKWYRTGDLGFYNQDGYLECIGRKDSQIKLGGRRIEIGEIEFVLAKFPATIGAVVVPLRDTNDIVTGCVAFITTTLSKEEENVIRSESASLLERVFFPKKIITVEKFPLTASGKIDRKALAFMAKDFLMLKTKKL